jgi:hypothetical protein
MGEGMSLPRYYLLFYIAILFLIISLPSGWSIYFSGEKDAEDILFTLLTIGNAIAIGASFKYWWWLKDELWGEKEAK